jgi:hypothetical protein
MRTSKAALAPEQEHPASIDDAQKLLVRPFGHWRVESDRRCNRVCRNKISRSASIASRIRCIVNI